MVILNMADIKIVQFISRNKDNVGVSNFKQRIKIFYTDKDVKDESIQRRFTHFVEDGVAGEKCRMYVSLNKRNDERARRMFLAEMVMNPEISTMNMHKKFIHCLGKCPAEKNWLFDFDYPNYADVQAFVRDIQNIDPTVKVEWKKTPNCFAVCCDHGFDTRQLLEKWTECSLDKDGLLFEKYAMKRLDSSGVLVL